MAATTITDQLNLFADLDADTDTDTERQHAFDSTPSICGDTTRGFFARVRAVAWDEQHGNLDCIQRSHAWRDEIGGVGFGRGRIQGSAVCRPTTLTADLRCDHHNHHCCCVGDVVYPGACLHCPWEGEVRDGHNAAVEDAHDHTWPGWRELPCVARQPERDQGPRRCPRS